MKKILLIIFFCPIQVSLVFSQTMKEKGFVSFTIGAAIPAGKFASNDLFDKSSGFAKTGESVSLSYSKFLSKHWGISVDIYGQRNPLNTNALESRFSETKIYQGFSFGSDPNNPPPQTTYAIYPNWKFEKKAWLYSALLLGGNGRWAVGKSNTTELITKVLIGVVYAKSPELKGSSITDTATANIVQSKSSAFGFIFSFSGDLHYYLNKVIFLSSAISYTGTNQITFKDVKAILTTTKGTFGRPDYSVQQSTTTGNGKQMISSVNLSLGVGIKL